MSRPRKMTVEVRRDDLTLARELIERAKAARVLDGADAKQSEAYLDTAVMVLDRMIGPAAISRSRKVGKIAAARVEKAVQP